MCQNNQFKSTVDRLLANSREREVQIEQRYQDTISRITGHPEDMVSRYTATPQPGHGPGKYQPQARATGKDLVALFVPQTAFDGSWPSFQQAKDQAISWLRSHRYQVEDGQKLCWGPAFDLDPAPLAYRDGSGTVWYNASIDQERDFLQAKIKARG